MINDGTQTKDQRIRSRTQLEAVSLPKNLAMALSVETAELMEIFQWLSEEESCQLDERQLSALKEEIGDVVLYLTGLADKFDLDPIECAEAKIKLNEVKYPPHIVKGSAKKYDEY